ncbi:MAG: DNA recombination protein RmuC [Gammaproteobacteria bacterium]|nr:MAG: DNA recombination protein RmuC [Gammaproteobacteria bacterium]
MAIKNEQFAEIKTKENKLTAQLTDLQLAYQALTRQHAALESTLSEKEAGFAQQLKALANQETVLKENFENLANRILENKGRQFNEKSKEVLDSILVPFKQQMDDFKKRVEDMHVAEIQKQSELDRELANLKSMNLQMTAQAHNLAVALQGQKKMQGNWGELVLENVLERSGLQLDKDYKREQSFSTENGRSRPDVVVYLPQGKHLIIDAKVSLNAYTRFVNSEEDAERSAAISEHTQNIANRIKELSNRHYYALPGLKSPEMVFMFIPIESAFVEALKHDEMLFQKAIEQNVLVATPTTLLTSLNIVAQLWRFEDQNRNTAELAERAGKIYDKLNAFVGNMQSIGRQLDRAKEVYDKAFGQLVSGRGNLIKQASDFKKLGISIKSELPGELVDKAELESEAQLSIEPSIETAIEPDFDRRP